jgi:hypothetical protein
MKAEHAGQPHNSMRSDNVSEFDLLITEPKGGDMSETYRAIEIKKPGEWSTLRKPLRDPGPNQVLI